MAAARRPALGAQRNRCATRVRSVFDPYWALFRPQQTGFAALLRGAILHVRSNTPRCGVPNRENCNAELRGRHGARSFGHFAPGTQSALHVPVHPRRHALVFALVAGACGVTSSTVRAQVTGEAPGHTTTTQDAVAAENPSVVEPTAGAELEEQAISNVSVDVVVVRDGDVDGISEVDDELARSLRDVGGFSRVVFSSVPLADLRLVVGCGDEGANCLGRLARALEASAIVVRRIRENSSGIQLSLAYHDRASTDAPLAATRTGAPSRLASEMPSTVRSLFGVAAVTTSSTHGVRAATWITLGAGVGVMLGGAILGASARWGEYTSLYANSAADVDRIAESYSDARSRATAGNVLLGIGALTLGIGGVLLLVDLLGQHDDAGADRLDLAFSPSPQGGLLTLRHTSRSFL